MICRKGGSSSNSWQFMQRGGRIACQPIKIRFMKTMFIFLLLPLLFTACKKDHSPTDTNNQLTFHVPAPGPSDSTDITGQWVLVASRLRFSVLKPDTNWVPVADANTIISFAADKVFSYNSNYAWSAQQYDRYKTVVSAGLVSFSIYATVLPTGNIGIYQSVVVQQINKDALLVSYMSTDIEKQEIYTRIPDALH